MQRQMALLSTDFHWTVKWLQHQRRRLLQWRTITTTTTTAVVLYCDENCGRSACSAACNWWIRHVLNIRCVWRPRAPIEQGELFAPTGGIAEYLRRFPLWYNTDVGELRDWKQTIALHSTMSDQRSSWIQLSREWHRCLWRHGAK